MGNLLQSRKFWVGLLDLIASLILFVVGSFWSEQEENINQLIVVLQPVILSIVVGIFVEDAAAKASGNFKF